MNKELLGQIEELEGELQILSDQLNDKNGSQLPFLMLSRLAVDLNGAMTKLRKHRELLTAATGDQ